MEIHDFPTRRFKYLFEVDGFVPSLQTGRFEKHMARKLGGANCGRPWTPRVVAHADRELGFSHFNHSRDRLTYYLAGQQR